MSIGTSSKSSKKGWIDKHHILGKKHRKTRSDGRRIKLTVSEHREIHMLTNNINKKNEILSIFMKWLFGKNEC